MLGNLRKKESVVSELARGRVSKFLLVGSNRMLVIETQAECFSAEFFNSAQAHLTCRVLRFVLSIKEKTLATFWLLLILCV